MRSEKSCTNWKKVSERFHATVRSIFNQVGTDSFKCIVACNEIPELQEEYDERLEFLQLKMPVPTCWIEMARDKFWKLTVIAVRIREILEEQENPEDGIYVMPVDGDDLLNCRIADYCERHPDQHGFVSKDGYVWEEGKPYMKIYPEMYTYCGSCNIIKMYREDLPEKIPADPSLCHDKKTAAFLNARYPIRYDHNIIVQKYEEMGRPFSLLPFRSTIYVRETSENISVLAAKEQGGNEDRRFHPIAFIKKMNIFQYKVITKRIKREFGMDKSMPDAVNRS